MLPTEQHVRTAHQAKLAWLVARIFPAMMTRGLQLTADWTVLGCLLDDHIEKLGTANDVTAYLQHLLGLFRGDLAGSFKDPFAAGMIDLRERAETLGPSNHVTHVADRMGELFAGFVTEARNRERLQIPDVASYMQLREITIGLQVMSAMAELLEEFSLPDRLGEHPALRKLTTHASNIVGWANDLFTFEKEISQGEIHNLVLVLMTERRLTMAKARAEVVALHDHEVHSFLAQLARLPSFGIAEAGVQRYVAMLTCWIRGHLDWAHETGRYRPFDEPAADPSPRPVGRRRQGSSTTLPNAARFSSRRCAPAASAKGNT
jgi:hypothetical protein